MGNKETKPKNICIEMNEPYEEAFKKCGYGWCYGCRFNPDSPYKDKNSYA